MAIDFLKTLTFFRLSMFCANHGIIQYSTVQYSTMQKSTVYTFFYKKKVYKKMRLKWSKS